MTVHGVSPGVGSGFTRLEVSPTSSQVVGDMIGQFVVSNDGGALSVAKGRYIPGQFERSGWSESFVPAAWQTTASAVLAGSGVDEFSATVQPTTELGESSSITEPVAHVVWDEVAGRAARAQEA
jgi:hypothetical protein